MDARKRGRRRTGISPTAASGEGLELQQTVVWKRPNRNKSGFEYDAGLLTAEDEGE
jgi:hypothetical protein